MIYAVAGVLIALVVVGVMLSRMQGARKRDAIADLARELEALHTPDIMELVYEEVRDSGIGNLPGAEGIEPAVLLKVWKRDRADCPGDQGRFVIDDGINAADATPDSVTFECDTGDE